MVVEHIGRAWEAYKRNFWSLVGAYLLIAIVTGVVAIIGIVLMAAPFIFALAANQVPSLSLLTTNVPTMVVGFTILLLGILIGVVLGGGYVAMARDALKRKTKLGTLFDTARARWKSLIGTAIIKSVIKVLLFAPALLAGLAALAYRSLALGGLAVIFGILAFLACLLFILNTYAVVIDRATAMDGIRKSYRIVRRNYTSALALTILLGLIGLAAGLLNVLIPVLGTIIAIVVVGPIAILAWTSYYLSKKK